MSSITFVACLVLVSWSRILVARAEQVPFGVLDEPWATKYGPQIDLPFTGPITYSHLEQQRCLDNTSYLFDIAILGLPFDTAVSFRPGARFGPQVYIIIFSDWYFRL